MKYFVVHPPYKKVMDFCIDNNMNVMMSYYYNNTEEKLRKIFNKRLEKKDNNVDNGLLFVDSGAFTAWTKGITIDIQKYAEFINNTSDFVDYYGQIDDIPKSYHIQDLEDSARNTWENYLELTAMVKQPEKIIYTFHVGEPIEYLIEALKWGSNNKNIMTMIALGGLVKKNKKTKENLMRRALEEVRKNYPEVEVHLFGVTTDFYFKVFDVQSGDSSNYIMSTKTGGVYFKEGEINVGRTMDKHHYEKIQPQVREEFDKYLADNGTNYETVKNSSEERFLINIKHIFKKYYGERLYQNKKITTPRLF